MSDEKGNRLHHAERNTLLAYERTYAAWVRTGLTSLAAGLAVEKLFSGAIPFALMRSLSMILIGLSMVAFVVSGVTYLEVKKIPFVHTGITTSPKLLSFLSFMMVVVCLLALLALWKFLPF